MNKRKRGNDESVSSMNSLLPSSINKSHSGYLLL